VRTPELRERFAEIHARAMRPVEDAVDELTGGGEGCLTGASVTAAMNVMQIGLALERLTRPGVVDAELAARVVRLVLADMTRDEDGG
jgi:BetI-type transcriptional repressor, C-terminal